MSRLQPAVITGKNSVKTCTKRIRLSKKNSVIADSLDNGRLARQYDISKASKDDCAEELKERKEKGELNPILKNPKRSLISIKSNIEEFFGDK